MLKTDKFTGPLAPHLQGLLDEKRALGFKYGEQERLLGVLDELSKSFDCTNGLSKELCTEFVKKDPNWHQATQENRLNLIRVLAEYMIRHDIPAYMLDTSIITKQYENFKPYIFTHKEIDDIFNVADNIKPTTARSHIFYPTILRLQYGCGLRISEALNLKMKDVDFNNKILHIKNAKNNKDRDVPFSDSISEYLQWYNRKIHPTYNDEDFFFKSNWGSGRYNITAVGHYFKNILFECNIKTGGRKNGGPHLHNLRHTFCVHSINNMFRNGISHEVALPLLMTYMGHASLSETGKYLKLTAEAFPDLVAQINEVYSKIMPDLEVNDETKCKYKRA